MAFFLNKNDAFFCIQKNEKTINASIRSAEIMAPPPFKITTNNREKICPFNSFPPLKYSLAQCYC